MAKINRIDGKKHKEIQKTRVAAYARVSTANEMSGHSFSAQISYYQELIQSHPEWEFAGVYADYGLTGTKSNRPEFQRMIKDAEAGRIQIILTKSISRFARNTVDLLKAVRRLKTLGISVRFEKENIWTLDSKGELLLTIMSSLAQEESRSLSENVKWGKRKTFADGKVSLAYSRFLGYDQGPDGKMVINEEQAEIVRRIYKMFLGGMTYGSIATMLNDEGVSTATGKGTWTSTTIRNVLMNEKYKGDALLQKYYVEDFLTKKMKKNEGEVPKYYVEGNHEAIISPEAYDMVQREIEVRGGRVKSSSSFYSCKLICGDCGSRFSAKTWHSTDKYRRIVYQFTRSTAVMTFVEHLISQRKR